MDPALIPVRMLTQFAYCNRLAYMEWVQGEFAYNSDVVDGKYQHRNVDVKSGTRKLQEDADETIHARSVTLSDERLGLVAKTDMLEITGKTATPVEYKRGNVPDVPRKAYVDHIVQLCAQGLLLRANGYESTHGMLYYVSSKQRIRIDFDDRTVAETLQMIHDMKAMAAGGIIPPPLVDSPKCPRCSLVGICLPDETNILSEHKDPGMDSVRRMYPMRNDSRPIYIQEQGARVSVSGGNIKVTTRHGEQKKIRLIDISEITVLGNVQITTQATRKMCERNIPICYLTYGGWFVGMTLGTSHKNVELRMRQHRRHAEKTASLEIARQIVFGKIKNSITMLRRNHKSLPDGVLEEIGSLAERARTVRQYDVLLGVEGMAARMYFAEFNGMIRADSGAFRFTDRNRRPPKDPINAILSFLYSMLVRQAVTAVSAVGFDPYLGFLHMPKYGKPALALDLIEEFRPIVADSTCITLVNNSVIADSDVVQTDFGTNLTSGGRQKVIRAYEQRMNSTVRHELLGYSASYRRIMETQARLLARHVSGEIPSYPAFRTR